MKRISGTIAPSAAAATGFDGISEVNHAASVGASLATTWLAASLAPGGNGGRAAAGGSHANTRRDDRHMTTAIPAGSSTNTITRAPAEPSDRCDVRRRRNTGDEQRHDQRNDRHPDRVHPQRADGHELVSQPDEPGIVCGGNQQAERSRDDERKQDADAVCFHAMQATSSGRRH